MLGLIAFVFRRLRLAEEQFEAERRRVEETEKRNALSQRMATVGKLAAGIVHEVNDPLAYVKSNIEQLLIELKGAKHTRKREAEIKEMLDDTLTGVLRIQHIVSGSGSSPATSRRPPSVCGRPPRACSSRR